MTPEQHVAEIDRIGESSWLVVRGALSFTKPSRNEQGCPLSYRLPDWTEEPENRFMFQVDGFTTFDAEITDDGLKIIYNRIAAYALKGKRAYLEDQPFEGEEFRPGHVVSWDLIKEGVKKFCYLSNHRLQPGRFPLNE